MVVLSVLVLFFGLMNLSTAKAADNVTKVVQDLDTKLSTKLDEISKKQDDILTQLADIKAELEIVKIRASIKV